MSQAWPWSVFLHGRVLHGKVECPSLPPKVVVVVEFAISEIIVSKLSSVDK